MLPKLRRKDLNLLSWAYETHSPTKTPRNILASEKVAVWRDDGAGGNRTPNLLRAMQLRFYYATAPCLLGVEPLLVGFKKRCVRWKSSRFSLMDGQSHSNGGV
jgi:hypothetical protein